MKKIAHKFIHLMYQITIGLILLFIALLSGLYFVSANFEKYRADFEKFATATISQPVTVGTIGLGASGLEPVLKLHNVEIFNDAKTKKILKAKELQIGINLLASLFEWKIKPGLILVNGSKVEVYQDKQGGFRIPGISNAKSSDKKDSVLDEIREWLFEQVNIELSAIDLSLHLSDGKVVEIQDLNLKLLNGVLHHKLQIEGELKQKDSPAKFLVSFKFHDNFLKNKSFSVVGDVKLKDLSYVFANNKISNKKLPVPLSGDINLLVEDSKITSSLFRQPMLVDKFGAKIVWQSAKDGLQLDVTKLNFLDKHLSFSGNSRLFFGKNGFVPNSDTKLKFKLRNLNKAKLYYPAVLMPQNGVAWLDQAFSKSKLISGTMVLQGPLTKFPFDNGEGKFVVDTKIRDVYLHYDPEWPLVEKITGKMVFAGRSMTITADSAQIMGSPARFIKTVIPNLDLPILYVVGEIDSDSKMGLDFVNASPLKKSIGHKLQDIKLSGPMKFDLKMKMPLSDDLKDQETQVSGDIGLRNNLLSSKSWGIKANKISGDLHFKNGDLTAQDIQGVLFNKPVKIGIVTIDPDRDDAITRVNIVGSANVSDFYDSFPDNLSSYVFGNFNYNALLDLHDRAVPNTLKIESNLNGLGLKLPEPFGKTKNSKSKLNLTYSFGGNKLPGLNLNYNDQIDAALIFNKDSFQLAAGDLRFNSKGAKVTSSSGLLISGNFNELDYSKWQKYLKGLKKDFTSDSNIIRQIGLKIAKLHIFDQVFTKVLLKMIPHKNGWKIALAMPNIKGDIYLPHDNDKVITGNFSKFHWKSDGGDTKDLASLDPEKIPPLKLTINDLVYGKKRFNRVLLNTEPKKNGIKVNKLDIIDSEFEVDATGEWLKSEHGQRTVFKGSISSDNVGNLLKKWDLTDTMLDGKGGANFVLKWPETPYNPSLLNLDGSVFIHISNGRIINLSKSTENKLGFGRILSLLSLQSLPRRLTLDFSDFTGQGFGFDTMEGDLKIAKANVKLEKIHLDGPIANIKAYGTVGLEKQNYDIMLSAAPRITSSIPVVATIAGGPLVGALSFVAEKIISSAIKKTATYKYHITGLWSDSKFNVNKL